MTIADLIEQKLDEYGIEIINQYEYENDNFFVTDDMIICYKNEVEKLAVAFEASTIPERVANNIMILQEIENLNKDFEIMESFAYENHHYVSGKKAHETARKTLRNKYIQQEEFFNKLLQNPIGSA